MGGANSSRRESFDLQGEVNFDHFQILRAIGKGSFGKVCIVQKKDTKKMYAMKYMNKLMCIKKDAVRNVYREIEILTSLEHPFLVNLWFTFQDEEDMFMVVDLLLGGDLRYHIQQEVQFDEYQVRLYVCEIALALDYLQQNNIVHRDIKPDNILLDEEGHVHITDFNIATVLSDGQLATSMSGTTPYMAPEVFACALDECPGYSYPVDWWSLGICAYEMLKGRRPYDIHTGTSIFEIKQIFMTCKVHYSQSMHEGVKDLIKQLLTLDPDRRISSLDSLKRQYFMSELDFDKVLQRQVKPTFEPSKDHLNCDPTYELEEMIIESKPLHKKKKRLAKQNSKRGELSRQASVESDNTIEEENIYKYFMVYNREKIKYEHEQVETKEEEVKRPPLCGIRVNESFDCEDEDENHDEVLNSSFDRTDLQQRLSVHSAIEVGGRRHSGKTVTFSDRRLSDYTCYSRDDQLRSSERTGIIKPMLKDRRLSDLTGQKSSLIDRSDSTGTSQKSSLIDRSDSTGTS